LIKALESYLISEDTMLLSVVMHTCRKDDPNLPAPVLQMMLDSLLAQEYGGPHELIIVDLLYEQRREWFADLLCRYQRENRDWACSVLHVPDRSTPFKDEGLLRICSPKNTGILLARGTHVVFTDDCQVLPADGLSLLANWATRGAGATTCYKKALWRKDKEDHITGKDQRGVHLQVAPGEGKIVQTRQIGFLGGTLSMLPLETLLALNGWDEGFDGSRQLEDGDMILRLTAYGQQMAYENRTTVTEYEVGAYDESVVSTQPIKCNGAYAQWKWSHLHIEANRGYDSETIRRMGWENCIRMAEDKKCTPHMSPCTLLGDPEQLERIFTDPRLTFDLRQEREKINWENAHARLRS
jgi:hypothetical protein